MSYDIRIMYSCSIIHIQDINNAIKNNKAKIGVRYLYTGKF